MGIENLCHQGVIYDSAVLSNDLEELLMLVKCAVCGALFDESMWQCPDCGAEAPLRKGVHGFFVGLLTGDASGEA